MEEPCNMELSCLNETQLHLKLLEGKEEIVIEFTDDTQVELQTKVDEIEIKEEPLDVDPKEGKKECSECGMFFKHLARHLETHGPYNCLDCLLHFKTKKAYHDHIEEVHHQDSTTHRCTICDLGFINLTKLALHNFEHTQKYSCPLCQFTVKGKYKHSLINHIKRHEKKFSFHCDICGQGFVGKNFLASHMEIHEDIPKYECEFCKKKFTVKRYLEVHKSLNHKKELYGIEEMFQCEICGRKFTFEKSLVRHLSAIHKVGEDRTKDCPVCHKRIANNHNLKKHMRVHTGEKRFCCDQCGKAFAEKKYLQKHQARHQREESNVKELKQGMPTMPKPHLPPAFVAVAGKPEFPACIPLTYPKFGYYPGFEDSDYDDDDDDVGMDPLGFYFNGMPPRSQPQLFLVKTDTGLQVILDTVAPKTLRKPIECTVCGKHYMHIGRHMRTKHSIPVPKAPKLCPICGKLAHPQTHHHHNKELACNICFAGFKTERELKQHEDIHSGEHYKCDQCPLIFKTLAEMALHHYVHTNVYMCPKCKSTFKSRQSLRCHVANEEQVFKYICEICHKGFTLKNDLRNHLELHENGKKYQCTLCDKKFNLKVYLKNHQRLNHKMELFGVEEVFQCEYCSRTFTFECSLKRHLSLVHKVGGEKRVQCEICSKILTTTYSLTVHMRLHTGEKNYTCGVCGDKFSRSQYLTRHMARRHGVE